jgi:hypothetical protein
MDNKRISKLGTTVTFSTDDEERFVRFHLSKVVSSILG